jgi:hypothetical protein
MAVTLRIPVPDEGAAEQLLANLADPGNGYATTVLVEDDRVFATVKLFSPDDVKTVEADLKDRGFKVVRA